MNVAAVCIYYECKHLSEVTVFVADKYDGSKQEKQIVHICKRTGRILGSYESTKRFVEAVTAFNTRDCKCIHIKKMKLLSKLEKTL